MLEIYGEWIDASEIDSLSYKCSYCGEKISSNIGYFTKSLYVKDELSSTIYICHNCNCPTFFDHYGNQYPGSIYGNSVKHIDAKDVNELYDEARKCISCNAFTASVLCSRKLLMNIAVAKGAKEGLHFVQYVEYLATEGYVPPNGKEWVDHIRKKGNQATHEIEIMTKEDAEELIDFLDMLLKFIFEFPAIMKSKIK